MARCWTDEQSTAFSERGRTLLVSAAAGSGKTATLTERIIRTLTDPVHPGDISRMLVVTFTRAAAGELRTRVAEELHAAVARGEQTAHLSRQLLLLPAARISTIDSFCLDLVRTHAVRLGLSPAFRLADATENRLLLESVLNRLFDEAYSGELSAVDTEEFLRLADALAGKKGDEEFVPLLLSLYESTRGFARSYRILGDMAADLQASAALSPFETAVGGYIREKVKETLRGYLCLYDDALALLLTDDEGAKKWHPGYAEERADIVTALRAADRGYTPLAEALASLGKHKIGSIREENKSDDLRAVQTMRRDWFKVAGNLRTAYFSYAEDEWESLLSGLAAHIRPLAALLSEFGLRVSEEKRRRGIMDFGDVAHAAYALLYDAGGEITPLAREIASEFDFVYVDEYQDVNELQHRIFEAVSPVRGRFMVGDVKQSIYGFRGAQPEIFAKTRADFPSYDPAAGDPASSLSLTRNFRSFSPVLSFVNLVFGRLMETGLGTHIGYRNEDALAAGLSTPVGAAPVTVSLFSSKREASEEDSPLSPDDDEPTEDSFSDVEETEEDAEAVYVADEIARLLREGKKADGSRLRPGDIAVIARYSTAFPKFAGALAARGIPAEGTSKRGFFLNPEVLLALSLLHVIDNPRRDVHLAGLLRSPLYGFTMDELVSLRREADEETGDSGRREKTLTLYEALCRYTEVHPDFEKGRFFLSSLHKFRRMAEGEPVDRLIWQLYRETGLLAIAGADREGRPAERRQNLMLLYDYARRFESSSFRGLYNFMDYIQEAIDRGESIEERTGGENTRDAVEIITMHRAKGLEYPVCFVVDVGHRFDRRDASAPILFDRTLGCALQMRDKTGYARLRNPVYRAISSAITDRETEEEMRVLYVALTRARERLYVTGTLPDAGVAYARACGARTHFSRGDAYACRNHAEMILDTAGEDPASLFFADGALLNSPEEATLRFFHSEECREGISAPPTVCDEKKGDTPPTDCAELLRRRFDAVYPDRYLTDLPKKLSVSRLYPTVLDGADSEIPLLETHKEEPPALHNATSPASEKGERTTDTLFAEFRFVDEYGGTRVFRVGENGEALDASLFSSDNEKTPSREERGMPATGYLPRFMGGEEGMAAKRGTATHLFLQFADFGLLGAHGAKAELARLIEKNFLSPEDGALVRLGEIEVFRESPLFAALTEEGARLYRELRFHASLPAAAFTVDPERRAAYGDRTVLVQGVMDGILLRPDGTLWLFDYKTDRLSPAAKKDPALVEETLASRYRSQLSYYAAAATAIFGKAPDRVMIYSLALGDTVEVTELFSLSGE